MTQRDETDSLAAARGVVNGLLLCVPFWIVVGVVLVAAGVIG